VPEQHSAEGAHSSSVCRLLLYAIKPHRRIGIRELDLLGLNCRIQPDFAAGSRGFSDGGFVGSADTISLGSLQMTREDARIRLSLWMMNRVFAVFA